MRRRNFSPNFFVFVSKVQLAVLIIVWEMARTPTLGDRYRPAFGGFPPFDSNGNLVSQPQAGPEPETVIDSYSIEVMIKCLYVPSSYSPLRT